MMGEDLNGFVGGANREEEVMGTFSVKERSGD